MNDQPHNSSFPYRHVIWDWNGTLLDDAWLCVEVMNLSLARRDLPQLSHAQYMEVFTFPVIDYYRKLGFDFTRESWEAAGTEFMDAYEQRKYQCRLQPGAVDVLRQLHRRGVPQSILSAYKHGTLEEIVQHHGLRHYFDHLMGQDDHYARGKLEQGRRLMGKLHPAPHEILLIGDTVHDFEVARDLGVDCWLIPGGNHTREKLALCGVPVLDRLAAVWDTGNGGLSDSSDGFPCSLSQ